MTEGRGQIDLHLPPLPTRSARELSAVLRAAIRSGRLTPGSRLPSARQLAGELHLAKNTVAEAYAGLAAEGLLRTRVGAGTWVSDQALLSPPSHTDRALRPRLDLRAGLVDATDFPVTRWTDALHTALTESDVAAGYPPMAGDRRLRTELAGYLGRTRGCVLEGSTVVTGHGFADVLALAARALVARGIRTVAVEEYGHQAHREILVGAGLRLVVVPVDEHGAQVRWLEDSPARAVLLTPAHQFPTGAALAEERRHRLVQWAVRVDGWVLEDDYDGEFRYDRRSVGAVQGLAPDRVLYLGSASKALSPAIGLAWALVPTGIGTAIIEQRERVGGAPAGIHERTLAHFIARHDYDRAVRSRRGMFRARRELLVDLLSRHAPIARVTGHPAGLHALVALPAETTARVEAAAARAGIAVDAVNRFRAPGAVHAQTGHHGLVVGYGAAAPAAAHEAIRRLVAIIAAAASVPRDRLPSVTEPA